MKDKKMIFGIAVIVAVFAFSTASCSGGGGGKTLNSPEALKEYLDSQPANSPDKPIKVSMAINDKMLEKVDDVIKEAGKYVSLNIMGNVLTTISFGNDNLVGITLPNSVTKIEYIRLGNPNSITIPAGVTEIRSISGVSAINVNAANANFSSQDGVLFNKDKTTLLKYPYNKTGETYTIPNSVTSIGTPAFMGCTSLASITIPNSVTRIGHQAFQSCYSLKSINIPNSVTSIESWAFAYCTSLTSITFEGKILPEKDGKGLAPGAFGGRVGYWSDGDIKIHDENGYIGDLYFKYLAGGIGTYTRTNGNSETWKKQ